MTHFVKSPAAVKSFAEKERKEFNLIQPMSAIFKVII